MSGVTFRSEVCSVCAPSVSVPRGAAEVSATVDWAPAGDAGLGCGAPVAPETPPIPTRATPAAKTTPNLTAFQCNIATPLGVADVVASINLVVARIMLFRKVCQHLCCRRVGTPSSVNSWFEERPSVGRQESLEGGKAPFRASSTPCRVRCTFVTQLHRLLRALAARTSSTT